jgi:hypothetical protein
VEHPDPGDRDDAVNRYWREVLAPRIAAERVDREQALLFHDDPIGINFESNSDEYRSEAQTIVVRLAEATSERDVAVIVHEEFVRWSIDRSPGRLRGIARSFPPFGVYGPRSLTELAHHS